MAGLANDFDNSIKLDYLEADTRQLLLALLDKAASYYTNRLINLSPSNFSEPEEFMRKWQFYKGALEAINDLKLIMKGK